MGKKKQKIKLQAGHQRFEVKFMIDVVEPLELAYCGEDSMCLQAETVEGWYVAIPPDAEVKELPAAFLPGDRVRSRLSGIRFIVHSGPYNMAFGDTTVPAYLVAEDKGVQLIREHLLELDV